MSSKLRQWGRFLVGATRELAFGAIRRLDWTTDASTSDPILKKGLMKAWTEGVNEWSDLQPRGKSPDVVKPN